MPADPTFAAACAAIEEVLPRFAELVRRNPGVTAQAIGDWTLPEVACHLSHVIEVNTSVLNRSPRVTAVLSPAAVGEFTNMRLAEDTERDVTVLADRIESLGTTFFDILEDPPTQPVTWMGGVQLQPSAVACHMLEELLVHGYDVAHAARDTWRIKPEHAALAILGAAVPIVDSTPEAWVKPGTDTSLRARVEFRLRGFDRFVFRLDNGLHAEHPPSRSTPTSTSPQTRRHCCSSCWAGSHIGLRPSAARSRAGGGVRRRSSRSCTTFSRPEHRDPQPRISR
jgi:hypothetical protein